MPTYNQITYNGKPVQSITLDHPGFESKQLSKMQRYNLDYYSPESTIRLEYYRRVRGKEVLSRRIVLPSKDLKSIIVDFEKVHEKRVKK